MYLSVANAAGIGPSVKFQAKTTSEGKSINGRIRSQMINLAKHIIIHMRQTIILSVGQSIHSFNHSASQSDSLSVSRSVILPFVSHSLIQSVRQFVSQSANQSV